MTIDEAIQDFKQLEYEFEHYMCDTEDKKENLMKYQKEWEYYKQLAEWLEELKTYKEKEFDVLRQDGQLLYKQGIIDGYSKGIDDFMEQIKEMYSFTILELEQLEEIAEQLKKGKEE